MKPIDQTLGDIHHRINHACIKANRSPNGVVLLPVSKKQPFMALRQAIELGLRAFGENYVQEALEKISALQEWRSLIQWHLIGPLQSNKTREVAEYFDWVHTIDRVKIAQRLSDQRPPELAPLQVCIQVNISGENSKSGVQPAELADLAHAILHMPRLHLRGLLAIPEANPDPELLRPSHRALHQLLMQLRTDLGIDKLQTQQGVLDTLSMGMSADLEVAIEEGSTLVRVGSALFGDRQ